MKILNSHLKNLILRNKKSLLNFILIYLEFNNNIISKFITKAIHFSLDFLL